MNILMFMWRDLQNPTAGGAGRTTHELCKRWAKAGHRVTVFTSAFSGCKSEESIAGYEVVRKGSLLTHYLHAWNYYRKSCRGNYDLVIDQINTIPYFTPLYAKDARIMVFMHQLCREIWFYEKPLPIALVGYVLEPLYLKFYRQYPALTVSESTRQDLLALGFSNVSITYNAAATASEVPSGQKEQEPTIIFVGRLKKAKRPQHLLQALSILKKDLPKVKAWIVGDGDFKDALTKLARKHNLEKQVTFFGWLSSSEKTKLMEKAHCICVPSVREGWGLIVTEANALGTPAIVYDVPGLRDSVKPGINGIITEKNTPQSLANALRSFFTNERLMRELSTNARKHASTFNWDQSAASALQFISEVCRQQ